MASDNIVPVHFRTLEDGIVTLTREGEYTYAASCGPCGDSTSGNVRDARTWANTHAGKCRALPRPAVI